MTIQTIESHYYQKIQKITLDDFANITVELYKDYEDALLVYVLDHLHLFQQQEILSEHQGDKSVLFYWNILNDPVIPYLVGEFAADFQHKLIASNRQFIVISLDHTDKQQEWNLYLFVQMPHEKQTTTDSLIQEALEAGKQAQSFFKNSSVTFARKLYCTVKNKDNDDFIYMVYHLYLTVGKPIPSVFTKLNRDNLKMVGIGFCAGLIMEG